MAPETPMSSDIEKQLVAVHRWALATPQILQAYIFGYLPTQGCRTCIAVSIRAIEGETDKASFEQHRLEWVRHLERCLGRKPDLQRLHRDETPDVRRAVERDGILVFHRDAFEHGTAVRRNSVEADTWLKENHSLVPMREAAELFISEKRARFRQNANAARVAEIGFYDCLRQAVRQSEFEGERKLLVLSGTRFRLDKESEALLPGSSDDENDVAYWANTWADPKVATSWCRKHDFTVPPRWKGVKQAVAQKPKLGRPAIPREITDRIKELLNEGQPLRPYAKAARNLINIFRRDNPNRVAECPEEGSVTNRIRQIVKDWKAH